MIRIKNDLDTIERLFYNDHVAGCLNVENRMISAYPKTRLISYNINDVYSNLIKTVVFLVVRIE